MSLPKGWVIFKGADISEKITKGSSPNWQGFEYQQSGCLFVTSENVRDGHLDVSQPKYLPMEFFEKQKNSQLQSGDILINIVGASIGRSCIFNLNGTNATINQAVCLLRLKSDFSKEFVAQYLQSPIAVAALGGSKTDSARPNLSLENIRDFEFPIPPPAEQKKITEILSTWDNAIESVQLKIAHLETRYRQLQMRVFDLADNSANQFLPLAEVFDLLKEGVNERKLATFESVLLYSLPGFDNGRKPETVGGSSIASGKSLVPEECILFAKLNPRIPRVWYVKHQSVIPAVCSTEFWVLKAKIPVDYNYFQSFLSSQKFLNHPQIKPASSTNSHQRVNQDSFESFEVGVPEIEFQSRAGNLFLVLRREIAELQSNLSALKKQKQGLMQKLLTGKVRVKV